MTALKCHRLLLARKVHRTDYVKADPEYGTLAKDLLFWVMRHNFKTGDPKGNFLLSALHTFAPAALRRSMLSLGRLQRTEERSP
jgi:hypothetical protein